MKFLSITGPKEDIDRVADTYLSKYEFHLENALSELRTVKDLKPFIEVNPYKDLLAKSEELVSFLSNQEIVSSKPLSPIECKEIITKADSMLEDLNSKMTELKDKRIHYSDLLKQIEPFRMLDYDLEKILDFRFIRFRFGRISHEYFHKFRDYVYENLNTILYECDSDEEYVWVVYFVPASLSIKIDAIYSSLHFERIFLPNEYEGKPEEAYNTIMGKIKEIDQQIKIIRGNIINSLNNIAPQLINANETLKRLCKNHDIRKLAACTREHNRGDSSSYVFYILCGWMTAKDTKKFVKEIDGDPNVYCIIEDGQNLESTKPPTKLKNPKVFKPFEMFVSMYGLPAYNEIDPTIFLTLTYTIMFGMMFGDAGQGICLALGGLLLYKFKKQDLAAIISLAGISSTIFGLLYGSLFGYEDLIPTLWVKPMKDTMTVLMVAIGFGIFLIIVAMIMNIFNGIKAKDPEKIFFDTNGIAGLIFYISVLSTALLAFMKKSMPATIILVLLIGIPLILIFLKEPLGRLLKHKTELIPGNKGMFFLESFFELFEVLLSYITNTVSFVRVGAFALSHAGMMEVVLMLGKATESHPNLLIIILGNIFVAALEGLIVGIQVLRLEYYEMFSRFYRGNGKEFKPF